ncbi:MAG: DUF2934 domain-containing protein [Candidatus Sulfotelmatobacter sp.]
MQQKKRLLQAATTVLLVSVMVYLLWIRPWHMRWGATNQEVALAMPGDEIVERPTFNATRAITIEAQPEEIWRWLVQVGCKRAGWYSYDWIDNLGIPSAERILPEFQNLRVGDIVPMSPDGKRGLVVSTIDANRSMLWVGKNVTWAWRLYKLDERHTRLVTRVHMRYEWASPWVLFDLLFDPGDFVMMRKMLLGIKQRAEAGASKHKLSSMVEQRGRVAGFALDDWLQAEAEILGAQKQRKVKAATGSQC